MAAWLQRVTDSNLYHCPYFTVGKHHNHSLMSLYCLVSMFSWCTHTGNSFAHESSSSRGYVHTHKPIIQTHTHAQGTRLLGDNWQVTRFLDNRYRTTQLKAEATGEKDHQLSTNPWPMLHHKVSAMSSLGYLGSQTLRILSSFVSRGLEFACISLIYVCCTMNSYKLQCLCWILIQHVC